MLGYFANTLSTLAVSQLLAHIIEFAPPHRQPLTSMQLLRRIGADSLQAPLFAELLALEHNLLRVGKRQTDARVALVSRMEHAKQCMLGHFVTWMKRV